jgi:hypothetical protein
VAMTSSAWQSSAWPGSIGCLVQPGTATQWMTCSGPVSFILAQTRLTRVLTVVRGRHR